MQVITDTKDLKGKKVFVRVDFNVPVDGHIVVDDFRIRSAMKTINFLRSEGARIILASHFEGKAGDSLETVATYMHTFFPIEFIEDIFSDKARETIDALQDGDVVLLENLRKWPGEKANDPEFAKHLASFVDIYVNEAFSSSHREHASIVGVPKHMLHYAGVNFAQEVEALKEVFSPQKPFLFILGGAKFSTKLPLLKKYLEKADHVVIAGALMNNFYKEQGHDVAESLIEEGDFAIKEMLENKHLYVPKDVIVQDAQGDSQIRDPEKLEAGDIIMDVGPETIVDLQKYINEAKFILWNGPLGNYEKGYGEGTRELAHRIAESAKDSVIGGGDTLSVVGALNLFDKFGFVSTAGGAMLDYLANETLPGIEALK